MENIRFLNSHTHTINSHDGKYSMKEFIEYAISYNFQYLAITEHLDLDYKYNPLEFFCHQLDIPHYLKEFDELNKDINHSDLYLAKGLECGYYHRCNRKYKKIIDEGDYDVIINSVHSIFHGDVYTKFVLKGKSKDKIFNKYLDTIYESLLVPYRYDIVGHIGYVTRYTNFESNSLFDIAFREKLDKILLKIIELDKTIEINTHDKNNKFVPEYNILKRYYELGGRNITFSSDAHKIEDLFLNFDKVVQVAKEIGFEYLIVYKKGNKEKIKI